MSISLAAKAAVDALGKPLFDPLLYLRADGSIAGTASQTWNFGAVAAGVGVNANAGTVTDFRWMTGGALRWIARRNADAESTADAGSNWELLSRHDDGTAKDIVMSVNRATGVARFLYRPTFNGAPLATQSELYSDEQAQDATAAMIAAGAHVGITFSYNDASNSLSATVSGGGGGSGVTKAYTQTAHGFVPGNTIYAGASGWALADRDAAASVCDAVVLSTVPGATTYATLNPSDKSAGITLTNGNLTAERTAGVAGNDYETVRATLTAPTGYFEVTYDVSVNADYGRIIGFAPLSLSVASGIGGTSTPGLGVAANDVPGGQLFYYKDSNPASVNIGGTPVVPSGQLHVAYDRNAGKVWLRTRTAGGTISAWIGGGDPATGATPTLTMSTASDWYAAASLYALGDKVTFNFGATAFTGTVPTGYPAGLLSASITYAQLNPSDCSANVTLGASAAGTANARATRNAGTSYSMVRANQMIGPTDAVYFEASCNIAIGVDGAFMGFTTGGVTLVGNVPGNNTPSVGAVMTDVTDQAYYKDGSSLHTGGYTRNPTGGTVMIALNNATGKGWIRNSGASYPAWAGGGDPTAGTSPTFTFTAGQSWYPAVSVYTSSQYIDVNFGATAFVGAVPTGFNAGIYTTAASNSFTAQFAGSATLSIAQWNAVIEGGGSGGLVPGTRYFAASTPGKITTIPASGIAQPVLRAVSATEAIIFPGDGLVPSGGGGGISSGVAFPGSPANNDLFYRTDLDWLCFYDSTLTKWLTVAEFTLTLERFSTNPPFSTSRNGSEQYAVPSDYQIYMTRRVFDGYVIAPNDGSNYWTSYMTAASANGTQVGSNFGLTTTQSLTADNYLPLDGQINLLVGATARVLFVFYAKVGSAGNFYPQEHICYRKVIP